MECSLIVDGGHLALAWSTFAKRLRRVKPHERAVLGFDGSFLSMEARGALVVAHATGSWPGTASVSASLLAALSIAPPKGDTITVTCTGTHVNFGGVSIACRWQPISRQIQCVPAAPDWLRGIAIAHRLPRARIHQAGLTSEVDAAQRKLDALIRRVARVLDPVGITYADIEDLVERRLAERYADPSAEVEVRRHDDEA